jgi:nitrate reductase alpha subunit
MLTVYRGNLIGTSMRGHELSLKHFLGTGHNVMWTRSRQKIW